MIDPSSFDPPDKYQRSWEELPAVVLQIAELKERVRAVAADQATHPAARAFLQGSLDSLDLAAHKIHQACNL